MGRTPYLVASGAGSSAAAGGRRQVRWAAVRAGRAGTSRLDKQVLTGLSVTTTNRAGTIGAVPILVVQHIVVMEGIFFGLGFLGLLLCGRQRLPTGLLLFGSALLIFPLGLQQARNLYQGWPSSTQLTTFLRPRVQPGVGHYLAEDFDVLRYYLKDETDLWQWSSLDYFVYTDKENHNLSGEAAYKAALQEGYFDLIELSYGYHTPLAMQISQSLTASKHYDLVARIPIHNAYGSGYFWVWSKHAGISIMSMLLTSSCLAILP